MIDNNLLFLIVFGGYGAFLALQDWHHRSIPLWAYNLNIFVFLGLAAFESYQENGLKVGLVMLICAILMNFERAFQRADNWVLGCVLLLLPMSCHGFFLMGLGSSVFVYHACQRIMSVPKKTDQLFNQPAITLIYFIALAVVLFTR